MSTAAYTIISYPESSGSLTSGLTPRETLGNRKSSFFLIGCFVNLSALLHRPVAQSQPLVKEPEVSRVRDCPYNGVSRVRDCPYNGGFHKTERQLSSHRKGSVDQSNFLTLFCLSCFEGHLRVYI